MTNIDFQSGKSTDLFNPAASDIDSLDITNGLANKGHFGGHTPKYFSIAEHCLLVSFLTNNVYGLLHDAPEAYLFDPSSCYKQRIPVFKEDEKRFMQVIAEHYKLDYQKFNDPFLKFCDVEVLIFEFAAFFPNGGVNPPVHKAGEHYDVDKSKLKINYYTPEEAFNRFRFRLEFLLGML